MTENDARLLWESTQEAMPSHYRRVRWGDLPSSSRGQIREAIEEFVKAYVAEQVKGVLESPGGGEGS